ncbi:hypothetical protein Esti_001554 [Eimeria stiedai]
MRETFSQRVFLALCGDEAGSGELPSAPYEKTPGGGTFLPHLSLLGAIQSRQLGEFLDGKGICRVVSSDKPQAVECALLARQQLISGGKLVRLSQLQKGLTKDNSFPCIQEDDEFRINSPRSKSFKKDIRSRGTDETTSTRSPLTSQDLREPSIIGEDEAGVKPTTHSSGLFSKTVQSIRLLYSQCTLQNTCGSHFSSCAHLIPGRRLSTGVFNAEAMRQVVTAVQREDVAVVCATWEELSCCLQALEAYGSVQTGEVQAAVAGEEEQGGNFLTIPGSGFFKTLMQSCGLPYAKKNSTAHTLALPAPGSVWEVQLRRDAETLQIVGCQVKAEAKTDYLSRACTHMWESKKPQAASALNPPLAVAAVRERLESDVAALADNEGFVALEEAAVLGAVYGAAPTMAELKKWEKERGLKKTGHISRFLFLTLLGLGGEEAASEEQVATLFRLYGLSFAETVNYLEFISRVTDGCDLLDLGTLDVESLSSRLGELAPEKQTTVAAHQLTRGWSCRENIQTFLSGMPADAYAPSTASAAAVTPPERELLVKPDPTTGQMRADEVIKLLHAEGTQKALPEDFSAFLAEVPAAAQGLDATLLSALAQFVKFRHKRFSEATNGLGWLHIGDAEGLFEDFTFDELPHKLECRQFQRKIGTSQLHYKDFLLFGEFVAKRRAEFRRQAETNGGGEKVTLQEGINLARLWGFSPSLAQAAAMHQHLEEQRKKPQNEKTLVDYEELLQLLSTIPHAEDQRDELALLFKHFDESGVLPARVIRHLLLTFGEPLEESEVDEFFKHHNIQATDSVAYAGLVEAALAV